MGGEDLDSKLPCDPVAWEKSRSKPSLPNVQSKLKPEAGQQEPILNNVAVQEGPEQYIPGAWIHASEAVVSAPILSDSEEVEKRAQSSLWEELRHAVEDGDSIPTSHNKEAYKPKGKVERRALLVGGQYETDTRNGFLPGTPNDILKIYRMLLNHGYEKGNIRILMARAADTTRYKCQPTKKNIMKSLDWLVQGARRQDYRYFHFSGHGEFFESPSGKEARVIPKDRKKVKKSDTELYGTTSGGRHITSQTIRVTDLKRYCEALSAYCHDKPPHAESNFDSTEWENCYRICDWELNQTFSRLPEGCRLTCTLDCCHSARIANNNFKLLGAGFRGSMVGDGNNPSVKPLCRTHMAHTIHGTRGDVEVSKGVILRNGSSDNPRPAVQISCPSQFPFGGAVSSEEFQAVNELDQIESSECTRGLIDFATNVYRYFSPPRTSKTSRKIQMEEKLPDEEVQRDKIVADMLTWGGCHQRQLAAEFGDGIQREGYFTSAFVEAVNDIPDSKPIKIYELFDNVNAKLIEKMGQYMESEKGIMKGVEASQAHLRINADNDSTRMRGMNPQYIQLWTSLGNGTEDSAHAKLDTPFVI